MRQRLEILGWPPRRSNQLLPYPVCLILPLPPRPLLHPPTWIWIALVWILRCVSGWRDFHILLRERRKMLRLIRDLVPSTKEIERPLCVCGRELGRLDARLVLGVGGGEGEGRGQPLPPGRLPGILPQPPVLQSSLGNPAVPAHSLVLCIPLSTLTGRIFPSEAPVLYPAQRL